MGNLRRGVAWLGSMLVAASLSVVEVSAADRASQDRTDGLRLVAGADAVLRDAVSSGSAAGTCVTFDAIPVTSNRPNACQIISGEGTNTVTLAGNDCEIEVEVFISNWACMGGNLNTWQATLGGGVPIDSRLPTGISRPVGVPCSGANATGDAECITAGFQPTAPNKACGDHLSLGVFVCADATQDNGRASDVLFEISACAEDIYACGSSSLSGGEPDPGGLAYGMTAAFHIDAGVTGTLTLPFIQPDVSTWVQLPGGVGFSIGQLNDAVFNIPTGCCCDGVCAENVTLDQCLCATLWNEGAACPQNPMPYGACDGNRSRYLTVGIPQVASRAAAATSIQVTVAAMPLDPGRIGEVWWAGPSAAINSFPNPPITGAALQCEVAPSNIEVWPDGELNLFGGSIVPGASYAVRLCDAAGSNCSNPLIALTAKWGDVVPPFGGGSQPDFSDINAVIFKFGHGPTAPNVARTDLRGPGDPGLPNMVDGVIDFTDISADVDAFSGVPYPFTVAVCPASRIGR